MQCNALISSDRLYRYWLIRQWTDAAPLLTFIGVNPSTADAYADDPTIRKDIGFAMRLGFGGILKLNLAAYRATKHRDCCAAPDPIGPLNTPQHILGYAQQFSSKDVIFCWGHHGRNFPSQTQALELLFPTAKCFGKNPDGTPRHTLMLAYATPLQDYCQKGGS